jgi:hypothetical protein
MFCPLSQPFTQTQVEATEKYACVLVWRASYVHSHCSSPQYRIWEVQQEQHNVLAGDKSARKLQPMHMQIHMHFSGTSFSKLKAWQRRSHHHVQLEGRMNLRLDTTVADSVLICP